MRGVMISHFQALLLKDKVHQTKVGGVGRLPFDLCLHLIMLTTCWFSSTYSMLTFSVFSCTSISVLVFHFAPAWFFAVSSLVGWNFLASFATTVAEALATFYADSFDSSPRCWQRPIPGPFRAITGGWRCPPDTPAGPTTPGPQCQSNRG